jgi:hypothetical protein
MKILIDSTKRIWHKSTSLFRLKLGHEKDFSEILLSHPQRESAQAIQGMWQGYGQMRAARIIGRSTIIATGLIGGGLWRYQQILKTEKNELKLATENFDRQMKTRAEELDIAYKNLETTIDVQYLSTLQEDVIVRLVVHKHTKETIQKDLHDMLNNPEDKNSDGYKILIHTYKHSSACRDFFQTFDVQYIELDSGSVSRATQPVPCQELNF